MTTVARTASASVKAPPPGVPRSSGRLREFRNASGAFRSAAPRARSSGSVQIVALLSAMSPSSANPTPVDSFRPLRPLARSVAS
jgi:hypothetical protein